MKNIYITDINNLVCELCDNKANHKINYLYSPLNFSWDKPEPWTKPNCFFCCDKHKKEYIKQVKNIQDKSKPYLAELDESMNYCKYFERTNWNEWIYKRDWFKFNVNWLWDYKSFNKYNKWSLDFKNAYEKYFWNFNRFILHSRYNI
jgi:hypothetical protein